MQRGSQKFPLGSSTSPIIVIGTIGLDIKAEHTRPIDNFVMPGRKRGVGKIDHFNDVIDSFGIRQGEVYSGFTAGNVAMGLAKKCPEGQKIVHSFTTLAPVDQDSSSLIILNNLEHEGITVIVTEAPDTLNGRSLILPPYVQRRIVTFKDSNTPGIVMKPNGIRPGVAVFSNAAGDWAKSWEQGLAYAKATGAQPFVVASESQIAQLDDAKNHAIYKKVLGESIGLSGNFEEGKMLAKYFGLDADPKDPLTLVRQLQRFGQPKTIVTLTNGPEGGITIDGANNVLKHYVPEKLDLSKPEVKKEKAPFGLVVNTLGAGDEHAATIIAGIREKGTRLDSLVWTVLKAAEASTRVVGRDDAQSGQLRRTEFLADPHPAVRVDVSEASAWV